MDQRRLFLAIALSLLVLFGFQALTPKPHPTARPDEATPATTQNTPAGAAPRAPADPASPGFTPAPVPPPPREVPRLAIDAPSVRGSVSLLGARIDDLVLRDYHEEVSKSSPLVRLLEPQADPQPYYVQFGWTPAAGEAAPKLPGPDTTWTASGGELTADHPVTLTWDNGEGLVFQIALAVDDAYVFTARQSVRNATGSPVSLYPWARIRRDYTPVVGGNYILHEGMVGVLDGRLHELTYAKAKDDGGKQPGGAAFTSTGTGGWAGFTDKYWLTSLMPDQSVRSTATYRYTTENNAPRYQVDFVTADPLVAPPGGEAAYTSHAFAGAKVVHLLDRYEHDLHLPSFDKAVDFGWFYFLTKPIFYALDWLNAVLGNFGLAIMAFTLFVKLLFFPLANYSYRSMSKMKLLGPKMTALRAQYKDDPQRMQQEIMGLYKAEGVNPASGCLPMLAQIPVFFSLYKVIFVTIEMRHAPFFGWIHDLSAVDPTNVFNLFGLLPFDPTTVSPLLHLGVWPLIMGCTMFFQQKLNPPPPDPVQARMFQFMPVIFTFMLARFPAGLVIYWSWNNLLTIAQQWTIMRRTSIGQARVARS